MVDVERLSKKKSKETKQILANHKIPEGLKIVNIEQQTTKTKPPEAKSSVGLSLSKATITPVPHHCQEAQK